MQDDYSTYNPSSYGNEYYDNSYDESYYPPKEPKKFTCPDSGIVVDKEENCPLVCPAGTDLSGHLVAAGSNLQVVCNEDVAQFETCPAGTDLDGVLVTNAPEDCNIFATCSANTPLGQELGLTGTQTVEVADAQLCQLNIPEQIDLETCPAGSNLGEGALVTDLQLCSAATPAEQCPAGTTLVGVWVHPTQTATCDIEIPPPVETFNCPDGSNMEGAIVTDLDLCEAPDDDNICADGTDLAGVYVTDPATECDLDFPETVACPTGSNLPPGSMVTAIELCFAATPAVQCASGSDLAGVWVNSTATAIAQCNISPADITLERNPQAQCLKCADLALYASANFENARGPAAELRGDATTITNVFTVCANPTQATQVTAFNALITAGNAATAIENAFNACLTDAAATIGTEPRTGTPAPPPPVPTALQENSLTTNIQSEAEIPIESEISTFSPPTIAQGVEGAENSSPTLAKMEKLKQQWLDLLP